VGGNAQSREPVSFTDQPRDFPSIAITPCDAHGILHEAQETPVELRRIEQPEHPAERVVARNTVAKP
jgi:hypothetical protein